MKNNIFEMTKNDISDVYNIGKLSLREAWTIDSLNKELTNDFAKYLLIEQDDIIVGFLGLWIVLDEGQITNIAIHPDYRGKGLGKKLLSSLISDMHKYDINSITLEVRKSNIIAKNLYSSLNFKEIGIRKNFYSIYDDNDNKIGKEDAIIMTYNA